MKNKKIFFITILFIFAIILILPNSVWATDTRTELLDLTTMTQNEKNEAEGWNWDNATNTLTLTDANFSTGSGSCIKIPANTSINLVLKGNNTLTSGAGTSSIARESTTIVDNKASLVISGDGKLTVNSTNESTTFDVNNLIINSGTVIANGGSVNAINDIKITGGSLTVDTSKVSDNGWNDGLYACGSVIISGGNVNINAGRCGIFVDGMNCEDIGLKITGGDVTVNGALSACYMGVPDQANVYINTKDTITMDKSNIGIYIYNGNLTIDDVNFVTIEGVDPYRIASSNPNGIVKIATADYTQVDNAIDKVPSDLENYTEKTVAALNEVLNSIDRTKTVLEKKDVAAYVTAVEDAIAGLVLKSADYTAVDSAIEKANKLNKDDYEDFSKVTDAINAVVRGKSIKEQKEVDKMAKNIEDAIKALTIKKEDNTDNQNPTDNNQEQEDNKESIDNDKKQEDNKESEDNDKKQEDNKEDNTDDTNTGNSNTDNTNTDNTNTDNTNTNKPTGNNPQTSDNIILFVTILGVSIIGLTATTRIRKNLKKI